jgi:hypothetical protein
MTKRSAVALGIVLSNAVLILCAGVALKVPMTRRVIADVARKAGLYRRSTVLVPAPPLPTLAADRVSARLLLVDALYEALEAGDYSEAARLNSLLSQEAAQRARHVLDAWKTLRDPETLLVPRANLPDQQFWRPEDNAADLFPFLLDAALRLDPGESGLWMETLASEREICGVTPCEVRLGSGQVVARPEERIRFGTSEYSKDGLLALTERYGRGPWLDRMEEQIGAMIAKADVDTPAGSLVSNDSEVNGELLVVLTRLYWATNQAEYLSMAERIAEAYLFQVFPNNHGLGAHFWDFEAQAASPSSFRLRDHGSELIFGLGELFLLETLQGRPQAERYREPLEAFLDAVMALPRTEDGLFYDEYDPRTGEIGGGNGVIDTWGYVLTAYHAFDLALGTRRYAPEIERMMGAVASRHSFRWEGDHQDGFADAIESMLYLLPFYEVPGARRWVDEEIEVLMAKQGPSGFVDATYLDGNFIRTVLLYLDFKTQGVWLDDWTEQVRIGAARDPGTGALFIDVTSAEPWSGRVVFDVPRHATIWKLPFEYARMNGRPEWFTVQDDAAYLVTDLDSGRSSVHSGAELASGLPVDLPRGSLRWSVGKTDSRPEN